MAKATGKWLANIFEQEIPTGTINGSNTAFTLSSTPNYDKSVFLYLDGLVLIQGTHYTLSGVNITMLFAPASGQDLYAIYVKRN